jgi:hypothetical protein
MLTRLSIVPAGLLGLILAGALPAFAQVGVGTTTPNAKAALDIQANGKGLLIPRMDSATRAQISSPPTGLMVFQTDGRRGFWYAAGGTWLYLPDKTRSGDNFGNHTATRAIGYTTNDTDKLLLTAAAGANGSKIAHSGGWSVDYYAGPNNQLIGTHRFLTGRVGGWNERMRITQAGRVGIGTVDPRGTFDVDGPGDSYLVDDPNRGGTQSVYLPGHLYLAPYGGSSGTAYVQARIPNPLTSTNIGLNLRTTNAGNLVEAVQIAPNGTTTLTNLAVSGNAALGLVRLSADYSLNGNTWSGFSIACPSGTYLVGGGGGHRDNNSAQTSIRVNYSGPRINMPDNVWQLNVENTSSNSRAIRIYCICARITQ